jgi:hypothetical protein
MARTVGRRLGRFGITVVVVAVGTLIIGVAFALITVQITGTVASNELATTTTTVPPTTTTTLPAGDGLEAAVSTSGGGPFPCQNAITAESMTLGSISFDLNVAGGQSYAPQAFLCVTNGQPGGGNEITTLTVGAVLVSSTEDGCSSDEATVDPDGVTCGSTGELENVVEVVLVPALQEDGGCHPGLQTVALGSTVSLLNPSGGNTALNFGAYCSWEVKLQLTGSATYDDKLRASTDIIALRLDVEGSGA